MSQYVEHSFELTKHGTLGGVFGRQFTFLLILHIPDNFLPPSAYSFSSWRNLVPRVSHLKARAEPGVKMRDPGNEVDLGAIL